MKWKRSNIMEDIQRKREIMMVSAKQNGIGSEITIRYSQELDKLIYEYQMMKQDKSKKSDFRLLFNQIIVALKKTAV
ncbi:aspartyl-phosphate phosphatase Spo0E family protein [Cytobacillus purgationiresistens]|uniref:Stage 0 sporulation regulatory protein n=1 Tax=Cytobacillus purgationiresistens TaxID=863449 RepID=A0ABU0AJW0_9BACI|nr:aspartyl-phosphate phosphatase Spo0E family protein [Cytobacillus purgationiresistens]MDQ0270693.1 stage 0 sporulation regulatory protein [Cytobacillus purgationiresistens]